MSTDYELGPNGDQQNGKDSRLLRLVDALAIDAEEAQRIVGQYLKQSEERHPRDTEWAHQLHVADRIVARYSKLAAMVGGATALTGVVPGIGTAVAVMGGATADTAMCMKLQVDMCMCLAYTFEYDITSEDARHLAFLIAASGTIERAGVQTGVKIGSQAGVRMLRQYLKGTALQAAKQAFKRVGVIFARKGVEKAIPFGVGVAISGSANYAVTRFVGHQAKEWFIIDHSLRDGDADGDIEA